MRFSPDTEEKRESREENVAWTWSNWKITPPFLFFSVGKAVRRSCPLSLSSVYFVCWFKIIFVACLRVVLPLNWELFMSQIATALCFAVNAKLLLPGFLSVADRFAPLSLSLHSICCYIQTYLSHWSSHFDLLDSNLFSVAGRFAASYFVRLYLYGGILDYNIGLIGISNSVSDEATSKSVLNIEMS